MSVSTHFLVKGHTVRQSLITGLAYFGCVFAAGFALGVVRTVLVVPLLGDTVAVALELPIILAVAWIACRWLVRRFEVPARVSPRAVMGAFAFALLMAGEVAISLLLAGRSLTEHVQLYQEASHILGLAGQIAFALFPVLQIWTASPPSAQRKERQMRSSQEPADRETGLASGLSERPVGRAPS
jgi:hypothetical protein